jgi:hypothetical protein
VAGGRIRQHGRLFWKTVVTSEEHWPTFIDRGNRFEIQIVSVHPQNTQDSASFAQTALHSPIQIGNAATLHSSSDAGENSSSNGIVRDSGVAFGPRMDSTSREAVVDVLNKSPETQRAVADLLSKRSRKKAEKSGKLGAQTIESNKTNRMEKTLNQKVGGSIVSTAYFNQVKNLAAMLVL